mgnify:FL=1
MATVVILNDDELTSKLERIVSLLRLNADNLSLARDDWVRPLTNAPLPLIRHPDRTPA